MTKQDTNDTLAPETRNAEQVDEDKQAQSVAEEALHKPDPARGETEKVTDPLTNDDAQDVVDHMKQMEHSGVIDYSAYRGEPNHDDNEDELGPQAKPGQQGS